MSFVVFGAAAVLLTLGFLRVWSGARVGTGVFSVAIGEVLTGAALAAGAAMGVLGMDVLPKWAVPVGGGLLLFPSTGCGSGYTGRIGSRPGGGGDARPT